jgi:hypothetical protein
MERLEVSVSGSKLAALTIADVNPEIGDDTSSLATKLIARLVRALGRGLMKTCGSAGR